MSASTRNTVMFAVLPRATTATISARTIAMAAAPDRVTAALSCQENDPSKLLDLRLYPSPLSPPYPELSRAVELSRAMSASSRSALFALARSDILFEDEWLVVVNKPSGVYCEALLSSYSSIFAPAPGDGLPAVQLHLANRLDRDTSGLMVITKSNKAAAKLVQAFTEHEIKKTYLALCVGRRLGWGRIRLVSGHGRSKHGAWRVYATSDIGRSLPGGSVVRRMETSFELLSVNGEGLFKEPLEDEAGAAVDTIIVEERAAGAEGGQDEVFLVRAYPRSGRTHQIRLHCQHLGIPIKGDVKYGGVHEWEGQECKSHDLHAESLLFDHPVTGVPLQFRSPTPCWVASFCSLASN